MLDPLLRPRTLDWANGSLRRIAARHPRLQSGRSGKRKLLIVHLDGVPHAVLQDAVRHRKMPFLSSLVRSGSHRLDTAFWGTPASTPCFQAGLLYGLRHPDLPAYNWFDRVEGRELKMNHPRDAIAIENRLVRRSSSSLLGEGGTSYLSIFHGGACNEVCMSTLGDWKSLMRGIRTELHGLRAPRRHGVWAYLRSLLRDTWVSAAEVSRWARRVRNWQHERAFFINRFLLLNLAWELAHSRTLIDMWRGVPAIYLVFSNYDEVSHRRGPLSDYALGELHRVDLALEELYAMSRLVPDTYDLYLVTDHGHVGSIPFVRRGGVSLQTYLVDGPPTRLDPALARALRVGAPPVRDEALRPGRPVVIEAGNFAHVYLERGAALDAAAIVERHPEILARALAAEDIGIVTLRRGGKAVALIDGELYGADQLFSAPLPQAFSRRALADYLAELPHLQTAGDLVLYGQATEGASTVGFAWEFGSHGGLTRTEVDSTLIWPAHAPLSFEGLSHSTELHARLAELYRG